MNTNKNLLIRTLSIMLAVLTLIGTFSFSEPINANAGDYSAWISIFDPAYYTANNAAAQKYANGNVDLLWNYFVNVGIPKGDQASAEFNLAIYKENNPDLVAAFGNNNIKYYVHYAQAGKAEGRKASNNTANNTATQAQISNYDGQYGSAGYLNGRTLIVSVFVNTPQFKWTGSQADKADMVKVLSKVGLACNYIKTQCANWGCTTDFIYDWTQYPDLAYVANDASGATSYRNKKAVVNNVVNEKALKQKYGADNVVYLYIINTDLSNTTHNNTYIARKNSSVYEEIVTLHKQTNYSTGGTFLLPSSTAHEILHAFGAPDLYTTSEKSIINDSYVQYLNNINRKDIMRNTNFGDSINAPITGITAYYLGIGPVVDDVKNFGLGAAEK